MNDRRLSSRVILRTCASLVSDLPADIAAGLAEAAGGLRRVDVLVVGYVDVPFSFIGAAKGGEIFDVKPSSRALKGIHNSEARSVAMKLLAVCASIALEVVELVHCKGSELALGRLSSALRLLAPVA